MKSFLLFVAFVFISLTSIGQNFNRPVPYGVYPYEYVENDSLFDFHISVNLFHRTPGTGAAAYDYHRGVIFDPDGYVAWYQLNNPANAVALNNLHYNAERKEFLETVINGSSQMYFKTLDTLLQFIDTLETVGVLPDSHESHKSANGDHFVITKLDSIFDLTGYTILGNTGTPNTTVRCNGIQGFDTNGNLIFDWNGCDYVHPSEAYGFNYNPNQFDYYHMNSIDVAEDGNLIASGRHINAVVKIDIVTGDVIWRLGGMNSDFTFIGDQGFSGQHDARDLGNGLISIFDNGNLSNPKKSRGVIYELDTVNWTATLVSNFDPGVYGRAMGSHRKIGNYGVVGYGSVYRPEPNIAVHDQNMDLAAAYYFTDSVQSYRAVPFHLDFILPRPSIFCFDSLTCFSEKQPCL